MAKKKNTTELRDQFLEELLQITSKETYGDVADKLLKAAEAFYNTPKKPVTESAYADCIDTYNNFIIQQTGLPGKFDGAEGKAMKAIITYIQSVAKEKTTEGTVNTFKFILDNILKWEPFHQKQLKLQQINSNLINIINAIKNGNKTATTYDKSIYRQD